MTGGTMEGEGGMPMGEMPMDGKGVQKISEVMLGTSSNTGLHEHSPPIHCL